MRSAHRRVAERALGDPHGGDGSLHGGEGACIGDDGFLCAFRLFARLHERSRRIALEIAGLIKLLHGDVAAGRQRVEPARRARRETVIRLRTANLCSRDGGSCALRGDEMALRIHRRARDIETGFRLRQGQLIRIRVDLEEKIASAHVAVFTDAQFQKPSADGRCDVDHIGVDGGIVRLGPAPQKQQRHKACGCSDDRCRDRQSFPPRRHRHPTQTSQMRQATNIPIAAQT